MRNRSIASIAAVLVAACLGLATPARAQLPTAKELVQRLGIPVDDAQKALSGDFVRHSLKASNERELTAGFVFFVKGRKPGELVEILRAGLSDKVDPNTLIWSFAENPAKAEDLAKLALKPDPKKLAHEFASAEPGSDLNLSAQEIAAFQKLGSSDVGTVEKQLRAMLLARLQAYQQKGLAGIAPYARGDKDTRSAAADLRSATEAATILKESVPAAYQFMLDYPKGKPAGTEETYRWSLISAHGEPTLVLTHNLMIPEGDAWINVQRQFYVSTGYNCEQALAAFLPVRDGTGVFYGNRTSTDQVTGFGGGAKRSIGSKLLASQLEELFKKLRSKAE